MLLLSPLPIPGSPGACSRLPPKATGLYRLTGAIPAWLLRHGNHRAYGQGMGLFRRTVRTEPVQVEITVETSSGPPPGYESPYLPSDRWDELLTLRPDGLPPLRLAPRTDRDEGGRLWFIEDTTGKLVKTANQHVTRMGIWSFAVRGVSYYADALRDADLSPGRPVRLIREPDNPHDANAIAVHAHSGVRLFGHVNKGLARRLAPILDRGDTIDAISVQGEPAGVCKSGSVDIVAADPRILAHLRRSA